LELNYFLDKYAGHVCLQLPEKEARAIIDMGREAADRYERIRMIEILAHFNKGGKRTEDEIVQDMAANGYLWHESPYFEKFKKIN
jgi:hypothetical protein